MNGSVAFSEARFEEFYNVRVQHYKVRFSSFGALLYNDYVLDVTISGKANLAACGNQHFLQSNTVSLLGPNTVNTVKTSCPQGWEFISFYIDKEIVHEAMDNASMYVPIVAVQCDDSITNDIMNVLSSLQQSPTNNAVYAELSSLLVKLLQFSPPNRNQPSRNAEKMRHAMAYINANFNRKIRIDDISDLVDLSKNHFITAYKRYAGVSPHQYLVAKRLCESVKLLRTDASISEIAHDCGFYDQSHFTEHFRRVALLTPSEYRDMALSQIEEEQAKVYRSNQRVS